MFLREPRQFWERRRTHLWPFPKSSTKPYTRRFRLFIFSLKCVTIRQRPHSIPQIKKLNISGCSAVGSAPVLGTGCRRFEPCHPDQNFDRKQSLFSAFGHFLCLFRHFAATFEKIAFLRPHHQMWTENSFIFVYSGAKFDRYFYNNLAFEQ